MRSSKIDNGPRMGPPRHGVGAALPLRLVTVMLAALSLTMESAHVLEWPQKAAYDAQMYAAVNTSLYRYFAIVGGVYQVGAIVAAAVLAVVVRGRRPSLEWTVVGFLALLSAFGVWLAVVAPVNAQVADAMRSAPESLASLWQRLLFRWEFGHAVGFVLQLVGFGALLMSILVETPDRYHESRPPQLVGS